MSELSLYQQVVARTRYARWRPDDNRRETWDESVARYFDFFSEHLKDKHNYNISHKLREKLEASVVGLDVMPSMRAMMTAGEALKRVQIANFSCAATPLDSIRSLPELMAILMSGSGVGFSVERHYVSQLPPVPDVLEDTDDTVVVADSREGWAKAYNKLLSLLWGGVIPKWDVSKVRPSGARLKTFGGYASGPGPLVDLFNHTVNVFKKARGRRLEPIEMFSLATYVAQIVVVGGVRRSATICLFDDDDIVMRNAKGVNSNMYVVDATGKWQAGPNAHFAMANISSVFESKPNMETFFSFWQDVMKGKAGEPGIFNRQACTRTAETHGRPTEVNGAPIRWMTNPCAEIILRPNQMCNLTAAVIRPDDTLETLMDKVEAATILGTWQACVTDFSFLRKQWQANVEEERLLGVCLSGFYDHPILSTTSEESARWLRELRAHVWEVNKKIASDLGIPSSTCVTSVKPAGNCRPSTALVTTKDGIFTMEDYAFDPNLRGTTSRGAVVGFNDNGLEPLVRVKLNYGMELDSTYKHRWLTQRGFVAAKDLVEGDEITVDVDAYQKTTAARLRTLPQAALRTRYKQIGDVKFPAAMNRDLAWLLGYLWGDGALSINGYRIRFMDQHKAHLEKAQRIILAQFGLQGEIYPCADRDASYLEVGNKLLWHWLIVNDLIKYACHTNKELELMPRAVRTSHREDVIAFIAGMIDADGHVSGNKVVFTNSKDTFSSFFQQIALAVGLLFGRSLNSHGENLQQKKHMYLCSLSPKSAPAALEVLRAHSLKVAASSFGPQRVQKAPTFTVDTVEEIPADFVFDVTTDTGMYTSGAFVSHNSGELYDSASGIHPRWAPYYVRRLRGSNTDPMTRFLADVGVPTEPSIQSNRDSIHAFPMKAPEGTTVFRGTQTAIEQLEHWMHVKQNWATHTVSCTIDVRDHEWMEVGAWVYKHFDSITGLSFLPFGDHIYQQAPYETITEQQYNALVAQMPTDIDWNLYSNYDVEDTTAVGQEFTCVGGACTLT